MNLTKKRAAIVGTADSWKMVPWDDPALVIASLNDAYRLDGFQRADLWFDLHPLDHFHFHEGKSPVFMHTLPPGTYLRPAHHLEWLGKQQIPIYLHPDYREQHPPAAEWTHAHPFPKAELEAWFGRYFMSSPGWMMAWMIRQGCRDIAVYGIHLATEFEYVQQRPHFEAMIGAVLGTGKRTIVVKDGMRHYTTKDGHIALPEASPVFQGDFQYAFEVRPDAKLEPAKWALHKLKVKHQRKVSALCKRPWYSPFAVERVPTDDGGTERRIVSASTLQAELITLEAAMADAEQSMQRLQAGG